MAPRTEKSQLKRSRISVGEGEQDVKKPRRSQRITSKSATTPLINDNAQLPSPMTHQESTITEGYREGTITPPEGRPSQIHPRTPISSPPPPQGLSSPPADTQVLSQFVFPMQGLSYDVEDEEAEGVWGYLLPLGRKLGDTLVLRRRTACPAPTPGVDFGKGTARRGCGLSTSLSYGEEEEQYEENKRTKGFPAGGYLVGRHPECGIFQGPLILEARKLTEFRSCSSAAYYLE
ncbi:hypothetical protein MMC14_009441 [Varicellaria rhodocarpa]|nr:hypothetical protein [Varicellaria rhodocarpa]